VKLDYDFIRKLLIHVEEKAPLQGLDSKDLFEFAKSTDKSNNELSYTISKLKEGNLVTANFIYANNTIKIITNVNLTYSGHEYLNSIRDNKIWKATKKVSSKLSGISFEVLKAIAIHEINKTIGL
jgi:hypothetical protein